MPVATTTPSAAAARNARSLEQHRRAIGDARIGLDGRRGLVDRRGLAGERGLVGVEVGCFDQSDVRRDRIAGFEEHDVARHQRSAGMRRVLSTRRTRADRVPRACSASMERAALISVRKPIRVLSARTAAMAPPPPIR